MPENKIKIQGFNIMGKLFGCLVSLLLFSACTLTAPRTNNESIEELNYIKKSQAITRDSLPMRETFNFVYVGDSGTSVEKAKSECLAGANKKAQDFRKEDYSTVITRERVKFIDNIVTVRCQVQIKLVTG